MSDPGCVSADTEFLTPSGWKRIDAYSRGDKVAQFYPDSREIEFVKPIAYVKRPCSKMIAIAPVRGTSQRLSHEHRVLFYRHDSSYDVMSAFDYKNALHQKGPGHFNAKFCSTFSVRGHNVLDLSDVDLRIMVAVIADGHFGSKTLRCTMRLKKARKIIRIKTLLEQAGIPFNKRQCNGAPDFQVITFEAPRRQKEFESDWWRCTQSQLEIIADELPHWDSAEDKRPSSGTRFSTFIKSTADFAQYAFSAAKRPSSLTFNYRDRTAEGRGTMLEYVVHARAKDQLVGPGRADSVFEIDNPEGFKYCFEVPTSFLLLRHNGYIFATGNTGKTAVEIVDFAERRRKGAPPAIILATKSLLTSAWQNDFTTFAPELRTSVAYAENREEAMNTEADAYILNHDGVNWLKQQKTKFWKRFDGGTLIIDESTAFKHHTSERGKSCKKIASRFEFKRLMSGTPTPNGICDIWHQMMILDGGSRLGKLYQKFKMAACYPTRDDSGFIKWVDRDGIEQTIVALLKDIVIRHRFEDCVDIPPNTLRRVDFKLNSSHMRVYEEMQQKKFIELKNSKITAINGGAAFTKLLQIASGAVYDEEHLQQVIDNDRYELVMDIVEERRHSIAFFLWQHQRDALVQSAKKRGISYAVYDGSVSDKDRTQIVKDYQEGRYRVIFAHPKSAAHGLTLTKGTATIWASPTFNLEFFNQGYKRIHRIGQTERTENIVVCAENTLDDLVWQKCQDKDIRSSDLLNEFIRVARS